jgi:uncharacterized protein YdhG (YjbR/CyaY superfamily)
VINNGTDVISHVDVRTRGRKFEDMDDYIASFPKDVRHKLEQLRKAIKESAPGAKEAMSYGMPTFKLEGNLVHFAAYERHIGFYPAPSAIVAFKKELSGYKQSKGAVQFPINEPLTLELVKRMVRFRVEENLAKAMEKRKR